MIRRPPRSTLFPTRRSSDLQAADVVPAQPSDIVPAQPPDIVPAQTTDVVPAEPPDVVPAQGGGLGRSEEHTSELQSRPHLVCRLLLEKKKILTHRYPHCACH